MEARGSKRVLKVDLLPFTRLQSHLTITQGAGRFCSTSHRPLLRLLSAPLSRPTLTPHPPISLSLSLSFNQLRAMASSSTDDYPSDSTPTSPTPNRLRRLPLEDLTMSGYSSTRSTSPEPLRTPTLTESYGSLKKNLSFKSLRDLEAKQVQEALWRRGQPGDQRPRPRNLEEVLGHAVRGGAREWNSIGRAAVNSAGCRNLQSRSNAGSAILAGTIRAGVNLVVIALRATKKKCAIPLSLLAATH